MSAHHTSETRMAAAISVASCDCGCCSIVVRLHDEDGNIFAAGSMQPETAVVFNDSVIETIEGVVGALKTAGGVH